MPRPDPFSEFRAAVSKSFTPVAAALGLGAGVERVLYPDIYIEYPGASTRLCAAFELESSPWVYVTVTTVAGRQRSFGLHTIVEQRTGTRHAYDELAKVTGLETQVRVLSELTLEHAAGLLKGEPANLRELYLLSHKRHKERERADDPSYPGADEWFTLSHFFERATSADLPVYAYHAVLDYDCRVDEVAAFLGVPPDEVQSMLDQHDTVG